MKLRSVILRPIHYYCFLWNWVSLF